MTSGENAVDYWGQTGKTGHFCKSWNTIVGVITWFLVNSAPEWFMWKKNNQWKKHEVADWTLIRKRFTSSSKLFHYKANPRGALGERFIWSSDKSFKDLESLFSHRQRSRHTKAWSCKIKSPGKCTAIKRHETLFCRWEFA